MQQNTQVRPPNPSHYNAGLSNEGKYMGMRVSPVLPTLSAAVPVIITSPIITLCAEIIHCDCKDRSLYVVALQKDNITVNLVHHAVYYICIL